MITNDEANFTVDEMAGSLALKEWAVTIAALGNGEQTVRVTHMPSI